MNPSEFANYIQGQRIKLEGDVRRKAYGIAFHDLLEEIKEKITPERALSMLHPEQINGFEQGAPLIFVIHQGWFNIVIGQNTLTFYYEAVNRREKRTFTSPEITPVYNEIAEKALAKKKEWDEEELPF